MRIRRTGTTEQAGDTHGEQKYRRCGRGGAELAAAARRLQLGSLRIRDVMTTHPTAVRDAWTIDELVRSDILRRTRHGVFPVVDGEGRPVGILAGRR
ncbi:CBS domain-containing protein [Nocardia grenadensis]